MNIFVKICGLTTREDVEAVSDLKPDAIGFMFWPRSKRFVPSSEAGVWANSIPSSIHKVGVFVDAEPDEMMRTFQMAQLDILQLHGHETPEDCKAIPYPTWKALPLTTHHEEMMQAYPVDVFLLDRYSVKSPGGTGQVIDWEKASVWVRSCHKPVLLAGGLTPENVQEAIRQVRPWGVDVSSGVEGAPGKKDIKKVKAFIEACRNM